MEFRGPANYFLGKKKKKRKRKRKRKRKKKKQKIKKTLPSRYKWESWLGG